MGRLILKLSVVLFLASSLNASEIYEYIQNGQLDQAREKLSAVATASTRDGNVLFYQGLLETSADKAARLFETALESNVDVKYQEVIYFRLAQCYLVTGKTKQLSRILAEYTARWEKGEYRAEMARLSILLDELQGDRESALRQCDRYLIDFSQGDNEQAGLIDKARLLEAQQKRIMADKLLRQLSRAEKGIGIPQSLYMLGAEAIRKNRVDDAVFYYNVYRESYPSAVGLDHLVDILGNVSTPSDQRAEEITGTFYSVKVGVFSESSNAKRQADEFKKYTHKVEVKSKVISGKKYHVVYVGNFQDYEEALALKVQLEATHKEVFQVVAR